MPKRLIEDINASLKNIKKIRRDILPPPIGGAFSQLKKKQSKLSLNLIKDNFNKRRKSSRVGEQSKTQSKAGNTIDTITKVNNSYFSYKESEIDSISLTPNHYTNITFKSALTQTGDTKLQHLVLRHWQ